MEVKKNLLRIIKLPFRPYWRLRAFLRNTYFPRRYWKKRFTDYRFDLRGAGNCALSHEENQQKYLEAQKVFLNVCDQNQIDFKNISILDIGCGTGFYSGVIGENGGQNYLGIDITDKLFPKLREDFPDFKFHKMDISKHQLNSKFDLIIMIDVTQHIVRDHRFSYAMQNIRSHLTEVGIFITTSWLADKFIKRTYY